MLNVFPEYYKAFKCIGGECQHSCCIGWEIDIDEDTLKKYDATSGDVGKRLAENISREGAPHFALDKDERCPFLNRLGLCDLILECGEDMLCEICTEHPRFHNYLPGRTESGIGLCCEEAARFIIDTPDPLMLICEGTADGCDERSMSIILLRDELLYLANDSSLTYEERVQNILTRCGVSLPERSPRQWAEYYLSLERMDEEWTVLLEKLRDSEVPPLCYDHRSVNLLTYFLYRHIPGAYEDGNIQGRAAFAALSTYMISMICAVCGDAEIYNVSRLYSAEIEYSDENLDTIFDMY